MSESTIHLQREIPVAITETDIGAQRYFRSSLSGNISIAAITQINGSILIQVFDVITIMSVAIFHESLAMRQIEHTKRLAHNLIDHIIITAMLPGTRQGAHRRHISCRHLHTSIFTAQRQEFILLPREIHIDVQFHVLLLDRSEGKAYL